MERPEPSTPGCDRETGKSVSLEILHTEIDQCIKCDGQVPGFKKIRGLDRGSRASVMIVGQGPGRTEKTRLKAFSGPSGKRLESWLIECGASATNPRNRVYFTSLTKCETNLKAPPRQMVHNCRPLLLRQLEVIRPKLIITVGEMAYTALKLTDADYHQALCGPIASHQTHLFSDFGFDYVLLPWPHPSGLNRWLNTPENISRLKASFAVVKPYLV